jgi:hypothetical protein
MMRAHARAYEVPIDTVDLEALHRFLSSERSPPETMPLSDLDGFLTGIAVGPELVMPSEWLPLNLGGEPQFSDQAEATAILGAIMGRYNEILRGISDDAVDPVFSVDRDGTLIPFGWAEGFLRAISRCLEAVVQVQARWANAPTHRPFGRRRGKLPIARSSARRRRPADGRCGRAHPRLRHCHRGVLA